MPVPVVPGMLHAVTLPPPSRFGNGETEFAGMHRGRPHNEHNPRDLRRATTLDTSSTLNEAA